MNTRKFLILPFILACLFGSSLAQFVNVQDARSVAEGWVQLIIHHKGTWGKSENAFVGQVAPIKRIDRTLGYFCSVSPSGYVIVPLRMELPPVKAYSTTGFFDPELDEGMTDIVKLSLEEAVDYIEEELGPIEDPRVGPMLHALGVDHRPNWTALATRGWDRMNYQQGDTLLSTIWHQGDPYNLACPPPPGGDDCPDPHCAVGCGPLAMCQIMRHWSWPPYGEPPYTDPYYWWLMPDAIFTSSPPAQISAVAEICSEAGDAIEADYCSGSGDAACATSSTLQAAEDGFYNPFYFHGDLHIVAREDYYPDEWFNLIKAQMNQNRPTYYYIENHFIVCDGWQEIGFPVIQQYHMNYGWAGWVPSGPEWAGITNSNTWYTLDNLPGSDPDIHKMIIDIYPNVSLGNTLSGNYPVNNSVMPIHFRYFDQDAAGAGATFEPGQYLHFLRGVSVTCVSAIGPIEFEGNPFTDPTLLFSGGDLTRGIEIHRGSMKLQLNGGIRIY
jgi:hypothetical protein